MRFIAIFVLVFVSSVLSIAGQDATFTPMKGSATPEFEMASNDGRCLVFGRNIVKTANTDEGGENVAVFHREGTAKGTAACKSTAKPYAMVRSDDNHSFFGISANYFFIDAGTSAGLRTLLVYKTGIGTKVTEIEYYAGTNEPRIEAARYLYYDALSAQKGKSCPEAAKWRKQGGSVAWLQGKKMDLDTQTASNVGALRCAYRE
jgi:hypothetical protein